MGVVVSISDGFTGAVGKTPLIRLRRLSEETGFDILGKAELMPHRSSTPTRPRTSRHG